MEGSCTSQRAMDHLVQSVTWCIEDSCYAFYGIKQQRRPCLPLLYLHKSPVFRAGNVNHAD
jgi:hypothetical protein